MKAWQAFENQIEATNAWYQRNRHGVIQKIPTGTKAVKSYDGNRFIPKEKTGCDFIGHLDGVPIAFDCKSTENKTAFQIFNYKQQMVKSHQKTFLKDFEETGGKGFLLIQFNKTKQVFLVPIMDYIKLENIQLAQNKKSIPVSFFKGYEVEEHLYFLDYRKTLLEVS